MLTLAGAALAALCACLSEGVHQDDDLSHLQMAAWSLFDPRYLLDSWGRPGFTALYALPAALGWLPARLFSVLLSALLAWQSFTIARELRIRWAWLAPALVWLQPLFFTLSYTTLTETALAFYFTTAFRLLQRGRETASAALISLGILTRHEAVLFAGLWALELWRSRAPLRAFAALAWAPIAHNLLAFLFLGAAPVQQFLEPKPTELYGSGPWLAMLMNAQLAHSVALFTAAGAGALALARREGAWILVASGVLWLGAHSVIFRFGLFASAGYPRFLVPVASAVAIAAAVACERAVRFARLAPRRALPSHDWCAFALGGLASSALALLGAWTALPAGQSWIAVQGSLVLLALLVVALLQRLSRALGFHLWFAWLAVVWLLQLNVLWNGRPPLRHALPYQLSEEALALRDACAWMRRERPLAPGWAAAADCAWATELLGARLRWDERELRARVDSLPPGGLFLWECKYAPHQHPDFTLEALHASDTWEELYVGPEVEGLSGAFVRIFEKRGRPSQG